MGNAYIERTVQEIRAEFRKELPSVEPKIRQQNAQLAALLERIYNQVKVQPFPNLNEYSNDVSAMLEAIHQWRSYVDSERERMERVAEVNFQGWKNIGYQYKAPLSHVAYHYGLKREASRFSTTYKPLRRLIWRLERIQNFKEEYELEVELLGAEAAALYQYEKLSIAVDAAISSIDFPSSISIDDGVHISGSVRVDNASDFSD